MTDTAAWMDEPSVQEVQRVLAEMCEASGLEMTAEVRGCHGSYVDVELVGPDAAVTFGSSGRALDSLQYLANLLIARRAGPDVRVLLDVAGYRARREQVLIQLARDFAAEVKARQEECEIDPPMPPHERRIIHKALQDDPGVRTYSEGEEPERRVVIAPR